MIATTIGVAFDMFLKTYATRGLRVVIPSHVIDSGTAKSFPSLDREDLCQSSTNSTLLDDCLESFRAHHHPLGCRSQLCKFSHLMCLAPPDQPPNNLLLKDGSCDVYPRPDTLVEHRLGGIDLAGLHFEVDMAMQDFDLA